MKKFFTLITLICGLIPAIHGMETSLPVYTQKKYDHLIALIKNAEVDAFKPAFDVLTLPAKNIVDLRQVVLETKGAVIKELEALGNSDKNWSKIAKGALAFIGGTFVGFQGGDGLRFPYDELAHDSLFAKAIPATELFYVKLFGYAKSLFFIGVAFKGIDYGCNTFNVGLNYKQYLQNRLANLDAIAAHIAQA